jgi:uncharacterized membrane protein
MKEIVVRRAALTFLRQCQGAIAPLTAVVMTVIIGFAAIGLDVGSFYLARRTLQTTADLAAIAAANDIGNARNAALATITAAGYPSDTLTSIETGTYSADKALAVDQRFKTSGSSPVNAVRLALNSQTPMFFGRALLFLTGRLSGTDARNGVEIGVRATATTSRFASLSVGSRLASLDGGMLNAFLGALLGTKLSLSVMDYDALASANIDLFAFSQALGSQLGLTAVSYKEILAANVTTGRLLNAAVSAARASGGNAAAIAALVTLANATATASGTINLSRLIDLGPFAKMPVEDRPLIGARVNALDIVRAVAELVGSGRLVKTSVSLGLPGIASASLSIAIGEQPVGSPWFAVGTEAVSVHTAQTRVLLDLALVGDSTFSVVSLSLYVEAAAATATIQRISCSDGSVQVAVRPSVIDLWIGSVSDAEMTNMKVRPTPKPATLVNVLLLAQISGLAHVTISNMDDVMLSFSAADIAGGKPKTASTRDFLTSLTASLLGDLKLYVNNLSLLPTALLNTLLTNILVKVTAPIDTLLYRTLSLLGIGLGNADVWVHGTRCEGAVLVG